MQSSNTIGCIGSGSGKEHRASESVATGMVRLVNVICLQ